jgi:hypothetical protein
MFKEDTKLFYRNLGVKTTEIKHNQHMEESEIYWNTLWGRK